MQKLRTLIMIGALECYAVLLAWMQSGIGLRTDEAKYLLSIPYPHPPLMRGLMSMTLWVPYQDLLWRIILASLLVQSVWILRDMASVHRAFTRRGIMLMWLMSSAVVLQSGTIMMAVCTSLFGLLFAWLALRRTALFSEATISLLFLASLFTAYQGILFAPLVWLTLRERSNVRSALTHFLVPIILLGLYSLGNPFALSSMVLASTQDSVFSISSRLLRAGWVWVLGGSGILSVFGSIRVLMSRRWSIRLSFGLVCSFILLTSQEYYAILLTPLFCIGILETQYIVGKKWYLLLDHPIL